MLSHAGPAVSVDADQLVERFLEPEARAGSAGGQALHGVPAALAGVAPTLG